MFFLKLDSCFLPVMIISLETAVVRATADGGAELAGDPKLDIFTE